MIYIHIFRLVNLLQTKEIDKGNVWKIVKETRKSFLYYYSNSLCNNVLLLDYIITENIKRIYEKLHLKPTTSPSKNITKDTLKTAAEMFTYLNYCPPKQLISFYANLFHNASPKEIIQALTSIRMASQNAAKEISFKIFRRVKENLKFIGEKIHMVTTGKCFNNGTYGKCNRKKDIIKKDMKILGF